MIPPQSCIDPELLTCESFEHLHDTGVVGGEVGGAVPREDGDAILGQQSVADEVQHALDALSRTRQVPAPDENQKHAMVLWRDRGRRSRALQQS